MAEGPICSGLRVLDQDAGCQIGKYNIFQVHLVLSPDAVVIRPTLHGIFTQNIAIKRYSNF